VDGRDVLGTLGGNKTVSNLFSDIRLPAGDDGLGYNFAERPAPGSNVTSEQTAGIGFWANKKGQALIRTFENISPWLANTMPHLFGVHAGANNLAGKTAAQVAESFLESFVIHDKLDAQVFATALSVYATRASLGGSTAAAYGFGVSQYGLGNTSWNIGANGTAFSVANNTRLTIIDVLKIWDEQSVVYGSDTKMRQMAKSVFGGINGG
jgi:hypothetical protein